MTTWTTQFRSGLLAHVDHGRATEAVEHRHFRVADLAVSVECIGPTGELTAALEHLAVEPPPTGSGGVDEVHLTVVAGPTTWFDADDGPKIAHGDDGTQAALTWGSDAISMFEPDAACGWFVVATDQPMPVVDIASPFRAILHGAICRRGGSLLHAGAVCDELGRGALIVGPSGSGKSTTCVRAAAAGMRYLGDDYCAVFTGSSHRIHSLYRTAKQIPDADGRLPIEVGRRYPRPLPDGKTLTFLDAASHDLAAAADVTAIIAPVVTPGARTTLRPMSPSASLQRLAPSSMFQQPHERLAPFRVAADLVREVPSYSLVLGDDGEDPVTLIRQALARQG